MKAIFALILIVAFIGMAMAGVHHYRIDGNGGNAAAPAAPVPDSTHQGGSIFDAAANGINNLAKGVGNLFG